MRRRFFIGSMRILRRTILILRGMSQIGRAWKSSGIRTLQFNGYLTNGGLCTSFSLKGSFEELSALWMILFWRWFKGDSMDALTILMYGSDWSKLNWEKQQEMTTNPWLKEN